MDKWTSEREDNAWRSEADAPRSRSGRLIGLGMCVAAWAGIAYAISLAV